MLELQRVVLMSILVLMRQALAENVVSLGDCGEGLRIPGVESEEASITEYPYVVALSRKSERMPLCTGSIIHKNWILTASTCVDDGATYVVRGGLDRISQMLDSSIVQSRDVRKVVFHPNYWIQRAEFGVALLEVDDFEFNDRVKSIQPYAADWTSQLTAPDEEHKVSNCTAIGWASSECDVVSNSLRHTKLTVRHGTGAGEFFDKYAQRRLFCSNSQEMKGICPGDSGGPLVCNETLAGVAHVIYPMDKSRISAHGTLKLKCNFHPIVRVWMHVCPILPFISQHVPGAPSKPVSCRSPPSSSLSFLVSLVTVVYYYGRN